MTSRSASISTSIFVRRRQFLADKICKAHGGGVVIIPSGNEQNRNGSVNFPFRAHSNFMYLTGISEPRLTLLLVVSSTALSCYLFCPARNPDKEMWEGKAISPEDAAALGFVGEDAASLDDQLPKLLLDQLMVYFTLGVDKEWDARLISALVACRNKSRDGHHAPASITDVDIFLSEMRLIKDEEEIALMKKAAQITVDAHVGLLAQAAPGRAEYELAAFLAQKFRTQNASGESYPSIVASGANACVLHYTHNRAVLKSGELVLVDAGCEVEGYAADITTTFPVSGKFTAPQRAIYQLVLEAQAAALLHMKPGVKWPKPHDAAVQVMAAGLLRLNILSGTVEEVIAKESYKRFFMHRIGHWLGLDVHDVGSYDVGGEGRTLTPGMVLTVEPGCYIREAADVPKQYWNIGVRIEDDVLITDTGYCLLTAGIPRAPEEIERVMAKSTIRHA